MIIYGENGKPLLEIADCYLDKALDGDKEWRKCFYIGFQSTSVCMNLKVPDNFEEGYDMFVKGDFDKYKPFQELSLKAIVDLGLQGKLYSMEETDWRYIKTLIGESNE